MNILSKITVILCMSIVIICCWLVIMPASTDDNLTTPAKVATEMRIEQKDQDFPAVSFTQKDTQDFYQVIIDYNLFQPLGYEPSTPPPNYQIIGTTLTKKDEDSTAIILQRTTGKVHTVKVGDKIGKNVSVKEIKEKQVVLQENDKIIILHGPQYIFLQH